MKGRNQKEMHKLIGNAVIFAIVMALTFWSVFRGQNVAGIVDAVGQMTGTYMAAAAFLAVLFVAGEGCMIWYLLRGIGEQSTLRAAFRIRLSDFSFRASRLRRQADNRCSYIICGVMAMRFRLPRLF